MNDFDTSEDESEQFGRFCSGRKIMIAHHLSELERGQRSAIYVLLSGQNCAESTEPLLKILVSANACAVTFLTGAGADDWKGPHPELAAYTAPARALANHKVAGAWRERTFRSGMREIVKSMLFLRELFLQLDRIANLPGYSKKSECYVVMKLFNIRND